MEISAGGCASDRSIPIPLTDYHEKFASCYDTFYLDRNVLGDAKYAAGLLKFDLSHRNGTHVLDVGCGCGDHVLAFARLGIHATGIDRSPAMIAQATAKPAPSGSADVRFVAGGLLDFRKALDGHTFDGAVSMFQVFNCMETPGAMLDHLKLVRGNLALGSRFLIDLWNGAAVFADDPRTEEHRFPCKNDAEHEVVRITNPSVDRIDQICTLHYRVRKQHVDTEQVMEEFESVHRLLFLTPVQYRHLFELADLRIVDEFRRDHPGTPIAEDDWYISYLLQAGT